MAFARYQKSDSHFCELFSFGLFGQTILPIPFHFLGWAKWFENGLEWFEKKNDVEWFDFVNFEVV